MSVAGGGRVGMSRRELARLLSACESRLDEVRRAGEEEARRAAGARGAAGWRVGVTGPPGAGKSSLVGSLGLKLASSGLRVAVLAVDPSSSLTGGSVLGDRTRMGPLALRDDCFVRGAAAGGDEGGLNRAARHQLLALQAWADVVLVETVGVGQTEHEVEALVDTMLLVLAPGAGDSLQGMKRGLTELADLVVVNKADGALADAAARAASDYRASLRLLGARKTPSWTPPVLRVSAHSGLGLDALIRELVRHRDLLGDLQKRRAAKEWAQLWLVASRKLQGLMSRDPQIKQMLPQWKRAVQEGALTIDTVADQMIDMVTRTDKN